MFYGYENENQMRKMNPGIADHLISIAEKRRQNVCTRGKKCTGSLDGKEYQYADGSKDFGFTITSYHSVMRGDVFTWSAQTN